MKRVVLAALAFALVSAAFLTSCERRPDPGRVRALLVVAPGATDVDLRQPSISYKEADRYPADATITSLTDALARAGCTVSEKDPFNSEPGLPFNRRMEVTPDEGGASILTWAGAWICQPDGDVVMFGLQTTRDAPNRASTVVEVKGAYYSSAQVRAARQQTGVVVGVPGAASFKANRNILRRISYETCAICGATRKKLNDDPWKILYAGPGTPAHEHQWRDGVSDGTPVSDGGVVLVRRHLKLDDPTYAYGAFILRSQRFTPNEQADYEWAPRTDGGSVFDLTTPPVSHGTARNQTRIAFVPFLVPWSGGEAGKGFVSYARFPGAGRSSEDWELCLTDLSSFAGLDAADARFVYRSSPVD